MMLLMEGACGVGKTTLLVAMRELSTNRGSLVLRVLDQRFTYAPIAPAEDAGILDAELNAQILKRLIQRVASIRREHPDALLVLDTFHVTQRIRPGVLSEQAFHACDQSLRELGCRTLLLEVPNKVLFERTVVGRRGTGFARYASRFGATEQEIGDHFALEQRQIGDLVKNESRLPWLSLQATDSPRSLAERAVDFAAEGP
jgi:hypothetical protein